MARIALQQPLSNYPLEETTHSVIYRSILLEDEQNAPAVHNAIRREPYMSNPAHRI